jgi:hypothetical protein
MFWTDVWSVVVVVVVVKGLAQKSATSARVHIMST